MAKSLFFLCRQTLLDQKLHESIKNVSKSLIDKTKVKFLNKYPSLVLVYVDEASKCDLPMVLNYSCCRLMKTHKPAVAG